VFKRYFERWSEIWFWRAQGGGTVARRVDHTREELAGLVIGAAEEIARAEGLRGLTMRRIAMAIGYAPGSIYNAVGDFDEVVLRVNARTLERLRDHLSGAVDPTRSPLDNALAVSDGYLAFVDAQPRLWGLILEHVLPAGRRFPPWYEAALSGATEFVDALLAPLVPDDAERRRSVATLWAALHGLASLSTSGKLAAVNDEQPRELGRLLVRRFFGASAPEAPVGAPDRPVGRRA
jgi:AcrR family transcriptional regulator